jgi:hypothetical protein
MSVDKYVTIIRPLKSRGRARMSNEKVLLRGVDGRSATARRYRDLRDALLVELGGVPSTVEQALCRQAAALTVRSEAMQAALVNGEPVDDEQLTRVTHALARTVAALRRRRRVGRPPKALETVMPTAGPGMRDYLQPP